MRIVLPTVLVLCAGIASGAERDVQFSSIVGSTELVTIRNFGDEPISLDGWRLCTQNSTSGAVLSDPGTLDGVVLGPFHAITIRYANDALPHLPTHFNASDFGVAPFELDAYSISLYFPDANGEVDFENPDQMADHMQWKRDLISSDFPTLCGPVSEEAGLWVDATEWIYVRLHTYLIEFQDQDPETADSPDDFNVLLECRGDLSDNGFVDFFDISAFIGYFTAQHPLADFTGDGQWNFFDVSGFLNAYRPGPCSSF